MPKGADGGWFPRDRPEDRTPGQVEYARSKLYHDLALNDVRREFWESQRDLTYMVIAATMGQIAIIGGLVLLVLKTPLHFGAPVAAATLIACALYWCPRLSRVQGTYIKRLPSFYEPSSMVHLKFEKGGTGTIKGPAIYCDVHASLTWIRRGSVVEVSPQSSSDAQRIAWLLSPALGMDRYENVKADAVALLQTRPSTMFGEAAPRVYCESYAASNRRPISVPFLLRRQQAGTKLQWFSMSPEGGIQLPRCGGSLSKSWREILKVLHTGIDLD